MGTDGGLRWDGEQKLANTRLVINQGPTTCQQTCYEPVTSKLWTCIEKDSQCGCSVLSWVLSWSECACKRVTSTFKKSNLFPRDCLGTGIDFTSIYWPCTIKIAWVNLGRPYPGSYKQEIFANRGQKVRSRSTGEILSCMAIESIITACKRNYWSLPACAQSGAQAGCSCKWYMRSLIQ